jgi:hypothetical protein
MVYTTSKTPSTTVNQKGGCALVCPRCPPYTCPACPAWVAGGHRVVKPALPSLPWECRARGRPGQACRRVEEVVVCRRGGCAVQDEPGSRRSYWHAKTTIEYNLKSSASSSDAAAGGLSERASEPKGKYRGFIVGSLSTGLLFRQEI